MRSWNEVLKRGLGVRSQKSVALLLQAQLNNIFCIQLSLQVRSALFLLRTKRLLLETPL